MAINYCSEDLELARAYRAQAERHVRLQQDILDHLRSIGGATDVAEGLLAEFKAALAEQHRHYERIEAVVTAGAGRH